MGLLRPGIPSAIAMGGFDPRDHFRIERLGVLGIDVVKAKTIKNAVEAHGWVGVILSVPLFIVFWAGALTLFFPEVSLWSNLPLRSVEASVQDSPPPSLSSLVEAQLRTVDADTKKPIFLSLPGAHSPFVELSVPIVEDLEEEGRAEFLVDPQTGETISRGHPFELASFLYALHYNLKLPQGAYIVGLITLFFLVLLMTGLVIQLKNLLNHFFLYRHDKGQRMRAYDIHTVAGVVTGPFALMYALTGLMFNLNVLFYFPALKVVYEDDQVALMKDAGFPRLQVEPAGVAAEMPALEPLIARVEAVHEAEVSALSFMAFGDENAVIRFSGMKDGFGKRLDVRYEVASQSFPEALNAGSETAFSGIVMPLFMAHMGQFGGPGVRFLLFLLAWGVCGLILAGNVLWLVKREKQLSSYPWSHGLVRGLTLGACTGTIVATAAAFVFERSLPASLEGRVWMVQFMFGLVLLASTLTGFAVTSVRRFLAWSAISTAGLLAWVFLWDLYVYGRSIVVLWQAGETASGAVTLGLLVGAAFFAWLGSRILALGADQARTKAGFSTGATQTSP